MIIYDDRNAFAHYGVLRRSGRYPWGSGGNEGTNDPKTFLDHVRDMTRQGMNQTEIAAGLGIKTQDLRALKSIAKNEAKQSDINQALRLKDKGYSNVAIGKRMGLNESSVRELLKPGEQDKLDVLQSTSNMLRREVDAKQYIQIGSGVENQLGISKEKLGTAVAVLKQEGYTVHNILVPQVGTDQNTTVKVLAPPNTKWAEVANNKDKIRTIEEHSDDGGRSYLGLQPPKNFDSKRLAIRYAEQGGTDADGVMYIRPGVEDLSMGKSRYAQVRIAVDGTHYLKGMAVYKDDLPDGVDIMFNTNKSNTGNKLDVLKPMKKTADGAIDMDNPFGATIKPGGQRGVLNVVNEEADWDSWSRNLSTQMLSKQSTVLAKTQLGLTYANKKAEFEEISNLTNPEIKKKLLQSFSDDMDSSAVHMKAASLPRTSNHVILPVNSLKTTEIYAPNYKHGERVALIRHPHGGIFEIPELVVNNKNPAAKKLLGNAKDAVGINAKVAEKLSGADFDGDTVLVIPNKGRIKSKPALESLKGFDPKRAYALPEGEKFSGNTQQLMGDISNLITDMTIKGANDYEIASAVRHSMVVIDAEKHDLNHKQSAIDNRIKSLKDKYQNNGPGKRGASTLISRAKSEQRVDHRQLRRASLGGPIDPKTGRLVYETTGKQTTRVRIDPKTGIKTVTTSPKTTKTTKLFEATDANTLSSGTDMEKIYAEHSNRLKALANQARKDMVNTKTQKYSPSAKKAYQSEVSSLNAKLNVALKAAPREKQAQILANATISMKRKANPDMELDELKKIQGQALKEARARTGAGKERVQITPKEWEAIQAGAISANKLNLILQNGDLDQIKKLATPKSATLMTTAKTQKAQAMLAAGYTQSEVADVIGVSLTTLKESIKE